jgi:tripartite-type tricarboxylate transporter receptor subunit TctC
MGVVLNNVPYKGSAPAEVAVISGEVELVQLSIPVVATHYKAGRMKVYGIMSGKRSPMLPDVLTIAEQGFAGYEATGNWHGVFVPAKTPDRIVRTLHREIVRVFDAPEIRDGAVCRTTEARRATVSQNHARCRDTAAVNNCSVRDRGRVHTDTVIPAKAGIQCV